MLNNPNGTVAKITTPFTDTFPAGVNVYANPSNTCGGTATATAGSSKVTLSGGSIPANGSCTVAVDVTSKYPGCCYANKLLAGTLQTDKGSNTGLAVAMLVVNGPPNMKPSVHKDFAPTDIAPGGISGLTITLFNPTGAIAKLTAPLIDTFPAGMFIAGPAGNTCGGTATARMGGSSLTLTGGSIPAKGSCSVKVLVTAKSNGSYVNMLSACSLQTDKGCNSGAFSAVFTVGIRLSKTFSPARIGVGGVSLLTITLHNPGSSVASMIAPLTDKLPSGLTVSGNIRNSCGGTVTAPTGGSTVTLTGGSIPARSLCSITVNVTAAYPDCYYNMLPSGALQTNEGSNIAPYVASVTVN
jgi:Flp pilus assembly protein TadG